MEFDGLADQLHRFLLCFADGNASGNTFAWRSLPPGNNAVYARYVDAGFFMNGAVKIGAASLEEGKITAIRAVLTLVIDRPGRCNEPGPRSLT
jgi:hypothetical protein